MRPRQRYPKHLSPAAKAFAFVFDVGLHVHSFMHSFRLRIGDRYRKKAADKILDYSIEAYTTHVRSNEDPEGFLRESK